MKTNKDLPPEPSRKGFISSYPPFRHWKKQVVDELLTEKPLNIYIHVPFCAQKCAYCYYVSKTGTKKSEIDRYVNALCLEIKMTAERFHLKDRRIISIYFGGGTPTFLSGDNLNKIVDCLHENLVIDNPEFTVEAEPLTMTEKKAAVLKSFNVNRISLGVQSLCEQVVKRCNRNSTEEKALRAIEIAGKTGAVINIDLLSGLEGDTHETFGYSIKRALSTGVESITVYKMEPYANTEYYNRLRKQEIQLPSDALELEFMQYALEQFDRAQYLPWSFFTFTREGRYENVYASSIWKGIDCCAFGVSAFSNLDNWLFQNSNELEKYINRVEAGIMPMNRGFCLSSLEQMIRTVILGMKLVSFDLGAFQSRYGFSLSSLCTSTLEELESNDFITISGQEIKKTSKGILYGDYVGKRIAHSLKNYFNLS
jgi:oxygen-independent coproporphyrinogen-3 oxidase